MATTRIAVISDTHVRHLSELPHNIIETAVSSDWLVHCGDFIGLAVLQELRRRSPHFVAVCGNADTSAIHKQLPHRTVFEVAGKRIGVTHPLWGELPFGLEYEVAREFHGVDIVLFGHTHEVCCRKIGNVLVVNPGQGYPSPGVDASVAMITLGGEEPLVEIKTFK